METIKDQSQPLKNTASLGFIVENIKDQSQPLKNTASIGRIVLNAVRKLQGTSGVSLKDLKKFLKDSKNIDVSSQSADIKMAIKNAIDKGILVREEGNYKVNCE